MKKCPQCGREYDNTMMFCLDDGTELLYGPASMHEPATASEAPTRAQIHTTERTAVLPSGAGAMLTRKALDKRHLFALLALATIVVGGFFGYRYFNSSNSATISSVAVLPFENRSGNSDTDYLSDGLADSLIYRLSQLPNLKVSPTSSVMRYKGKETDVAQIAKELNVDAVMSGRLVQRGDDLSISVQLIDSRSSKLLWAEQYDRKLADLLATQREIAATIADKLRLKLSGSDQKGITKNYTDNNEAYQNYLRGRFYWNKRTKDGIEEGIANFQKAIDLDPNFALAYVGLADSYSVMPSYGYMSPTDAMPRSMTAVQQALRIDPELAEAHSTYGLILASQLRWSEAETELKRALEIDPKSVESHYKYALQFLVPVGRFDDAIRELKAALELDPLSIPIGANLAGVYAYQRKYDAALEQAQKVYALDPDHATAIIWLANAYEAKGKYDEAIKLCETSLPPENQDSLLIMGSSYARSGRPEETRRIISKLKEMSKTQYVSSYRLANLYGDLGEKDQAFSALEKSYKEQEWDFTRLKVDPFLDPLRDDPRFKDLLTRMNLPE
ncbi:MAG: tetratricopeptide repeat protein [Pyrinomonadaceae bacterium]|nr:tetratricopeptide repeat protein [Pyrinomonadaceae bacterium]